jgi:(p)ppGpp synthase/HD superfamily hydrolase
VIEYGGDEVMAIAALLHDAVEDQGGRPRLREIRKRFGKRVAHIVDGCTDSYTKPKPHWMERKRVYIERVASESEEARLVSAADKLSNVRETLHDFRLEGDGSNPLVEELDRVVTELESLSRGAIRNQD